MKKLFISFVGIAVLLSGCKFNQTAEGMYTGSFDASGLPVPSGIDATITVSKEVNGQFSGTLSYPGNPDVVVHNMVIERSSNLDGNTYESHYYGVNESYNFSVKEHDDFSGIAWNMQFWYSNDIGNNSFTFSGAKK
jgi:hypothetical protein